jgi:hypothetical protein
MTTTINPFHGRDISMNHRLLSGVGGFAITDDAVIFFFGEDDVIRDNNGPHQVSIPRAELASILV